MIDVLLVGNPNAGKTTLFNSLAHANEHVGNWHGVTVDAKEKVFSSQGEQFRLVDTPGIYSLSPLSFEERVAVDMLFQNADKKIINICDQNNLRRNLYLTLCLLESGFDVVLAVNEIDRKQICKVDCEKLSALLGIDVVKINAQKKRGLDELVSSLKNAKKTPILPYVKKINFQENAKKTRKFVEKNKIIAKTETNSSQKLPEQKSEISHEELAAFHEVSKIRYAFIDEVIRQSCTCTGQVYGESKFDKIALNKWLAFPLFLCVLAGIFYLTFFSLGAFLSDMLGKLLEVLTTPILTALKNSGTAAVFVDLFEHAILGGVGTVLSFLPQVVLLFFFLALLEDSGYMSRIAFIFEDILGRVGLSGKSVYTLLMGFGCSTSAIMTARNMEDRNAKIKTAILCPYMSCSAKIPIYTVIGGAFFGAKNIFVILGLYLLGVIVAITISKILDVTLLKSQKQSFILEFPPYRTTSMVRIGKILWKNAKEFLVRVGSVMISMNIIVWLLSSFTFSFKYIGGGEGVSMLEQIGRLLCPVFAPLGFGNWAIVSSLLAGLVAKEVVVSSIAMFNGIDLNATKLLSASIMLSTSVVFFASRASVISFLIFCLLYTPCMASISMLLSEIGRKWTAISILIQLLTAYVVAFVAYNLCFACEIFGFWEIFLTIFCIFAVFFAFFVIFRKFKRRKFCQNCTGSCKNCFKK